MMRCRHEDDIICELCAKNPMARMTDQQFDRISRRMLTHVVLPLAIIPPDPFHALRHIGDIAGAVSGTSDADELHRALCDISAFTQAVLKRHGK